MSSTLQKIADKLTGKDKEYDNPQTSNYGHHSSAAANKVDPRVDSDRDGRNDPTSRVGGYGHTQGHDGYATTTGPGGIASSDTYGSRTNNPSRDNTASTNYGPHGSNLANKLDPRVDSDRDGRNDPTSNLGGRGHTQDAYDSYSQSTGPGGVGSTTTAGYGSHHTGHNTSHSNQYSTNTGPHSSNLANKLDPRVDSDRDGRNNPTSRTGGYGNTQSATGYTGAPSHRTTTSSNTGYAGTDPSYNSSRSTNDGPHSSNLLNKLDPRVDSDRDGRHDTTSRTGGYGNTGTGYDHTTTTGTTGTHGHRNEGYSGTNDTYDDPRSTNTGPHSSNLLNKLDPRVDSDRDGRDDPTSRTGGYGQTQTGGGHIARY